MIMRLNRRQLNILIENFIHEQEESNTEDLETPAISSESDIKDNKKLKIKPFVISLNSKYTESGQEEEFEIKFFVDTDGKLNYKVNDNVVNKDRLAFVTIAGYGLLNKKLDEDTSKSLETMVKKNDVSLANYSIERIKQVVQQKKDTAREPFSVANLKAALLGKDRSA